MSAALVAACGDHFTTGDALGMFGMLAGFALLIWALNG